jgi:arylsulfatase A-like enzyme
MKRCLTAMLLAATAVAAEKPNVVLLYADDLGYGDISCYGAKTISTPNIDKLAAEGLQFTDGHCAAATCTPSRFAMLTGEYAFRQKGTGILPGDAKMIIPPGRSTLASMFKRAGYRTGVVGKWHLGLGDGGMDWNGMARSSQDRWRSVSIIVSSWRRRETASHVFICRIIACWASIPLIRSK